MLQATVGDRTITIHDHERRECDVWSRVMGYFRPVADYNIGKQQEHRDRNFYREAKVLSHIGGTS